MRDLAKALLVCAAVFTSVSAGPKPQVSAYFIPPPIMMVDVIEGRWLPFSLTGPFLSNSDMQSQKKRKLLHLIRQPTKLATSLK